MYAVVVYKNDRPILQGNSKRVFVYKRYHDAQKRALKIANARVLSFTLTDGEEIV